MTFSLAYQYMDTLEIKHIPVEKQVKGSVKNENKIYLLMIINKRFETKENA